MSLPHPGPLLTVVMAVVGAGAMLLWRLRETMRPVSVANLVAPPLGMSTGLSMFAAPAMRVPLAWAAAALLVGAVVLAVPLARTSHLVRKGEAVFMRRSRAFLAILLGLVAVRVLLRVYIERVMSPGQAAAILYLVALGMIVRWRGGMLAAYLALRREG